MHSIIVQSLGLLPTHIIEDHNHLCLSVYDATCDHGKKSQSITLPWVLNKVSWHELSQLTCLLTLEYLFLSLSLSQPLDWKNCLPMSVIFKLVICKIKWLKLRTRKAPNRSPYWIISFDVLLCQNWLFLPPNRLTLQTTLLSVNWLELGMRTPPRSLF
jgi:hypothetical protein